MKPIILLSAQFDSTKRGVHPNIATYYVECVAAAGGIPYIASSAGEDLQATAAKETAINTAAILMYLFISNIFMLFALFVDCHFSTPRILHTVLTYKNLITLQEQLPQ